MHVSNLSLRHVATAAAAALAIVPVLAGQGRAASEGKAAALAVAPACGFTPVTGSFNGTTGSLGAGAPGVTNFTVLVAGAGPYLWDVNLNTQLAHPDNSQIDMTLTSPLGTVVVITTDNGSTLDNGFNGTVWDDSANDPVTEKTFTNLVAATPLSPEGRLEAFRGENPNGTWTLTVADDANLLLGTLTDWSLDVQTLPSAPVPSTTVLTASPNNPIRDGGSLVGSHVGAGLGTYLSRLTVYVEIPHQNSSDLDLSLQGPTGLPVKLTTDNGGALDNCFNGTLFDGDDLDPVTDYGFVNLVAATPLAPESGLEYFRGTNPNGVWTLIVTDDTTANFGTFKRWDLALTTIPAPSPSAPVSFAGSGGPLADATPTVTSGTWVFTANASGLPTYLWDLDLTTTITHTYNGDLDITLESPTGSVVVVTTDNGDGNDDGFNGTLWDDQVSGTCTDSLYSNGVTNTPLSPEGRFSAFRGENPNGTWTMTIVDDAGIDSGTLHNWKLDLAAISGAPTVATSSSTQSPNLPISDLASTTDVISVAGAGSAISEVELYLEILHSECADLDITLTSPLGTVVTVSTDNGLTNDNVFNGSLFDPGLIGTGAPVGDATYTNNVAKTPLSPEGPFDRFLGENPNGNWTLTVADDLATDVGTLVRWDLTIRNCGAPPPVAYCFGDGSSLACPCSPAPVPHGAPGRGCPTNVFAGGALATASGTSSLSGDTLVLTGTDMINGSMIFFQGAIQQSGGAGAAFGDGKRCIQPTGIRRFKVKPVAGNTASYPGGGDNSISVAGAIGAPGTRNYQGWYRSANPTFCTVDTFNLTNGLLVTWVP